MTDPLHVLVVDDEPRIRTMLRRYLVEEGFKVSDAADGAGMRTVLTREAIDLVLLDLMMPGEDGLSLARGGRGGFGPVFITALTADAKSSTKDYTKILAFLPTNHSNQIMTLQMSGFRAGLSIRGNLLENFANCAPDRCGRYRFRQRGICPGKIRHHVVFGICGEDNDWR
jgi:CheY-like chemotaxis protein